MAFGILEDRKLSEVPGTGPLSTRTDKATFDVAVELKRGVGKYSHIVLLPQPSDDPFDPLNWPRWTKEACFWTLMFTTGASGTIDVLPTAAYVLLAKEFHVSVDKLVSSFGAHLVGSAICVLVQNPLAVKYGHRVVFLLCTLLIFISCVWTPLSSSLISISASRALQGVAVAPIQCLVPVTIEQLFFVHERGSRTSIWSLATFGAPTLGVILNSYITQKLYWQLGFWLTSIACGLSFVGVLFFVPETTYHRQPSRSRDPTMIQYHSTSEKCTAKTTPQPSSDDAPPQATKLLTFLTQVRIYNGTFSNESMWKIFLRPFPFVLSPVTWFVFTSFTMPLVCRGFVRVCLATIFTITYDFNPTEIGLVNIGDLVGIVPAMIVAGPLIDRWIVWMSQRNGGIYEPEYRLVFALSMLLSVFSNVGWAIGYSNHMPWIGAAACIVMLSFGSFISSTTIMGYLLDTHGTNALHVITLNDFAKYMIAYGMTFVANGLVLSAGVRRTLLVIGALLAVFWLSTISMYVYGKRVRSFIARHPRLFRRDLPVVPVPPDSDSSRPSGAPSLGLG